MGSLDLYLVQAVVRRSSGLKLEFLSAHTAHSGFEATLMPRRWEEALDMYSATRRCACDFDSSDH